jgi:sulfate adenylyltransferase subunit 1
VFEDISGRFTAMTTALGYRTSTIDAVPVSALNGDNVVTPSVNMPWYSGPTFLTLLEQTPVEAPGHALPLRLPVQYVIRAGADYRGYAGRVAAGTIRLGDRVVVLPSGMESIVERIDTPRGPAEAAGTGRSVTVLLADDVDIARGDLLAAADESYRLTSQFDATVCWLSNTPLRTGARLLLRHGTRITPCIAQAVHERVDVRTSACDPTDTLVINDIGRVSLRTADPLPADAYSRSRSTGSMLLIAPSTGETLAAGLIGE